MSKRELYKNLGVAALGALGYKKGTDYFDDFKRGRQQRIAMSKHAEEAEQLFSREHVFPLASESGSISWRQSYTDGLYANKEKMGKMADEQLKDLWPQSYHAGHKHGYRQRSMTSGKDAGSALHKVFKKK